MRYLQFKGYRSISRVFSSRQTAWNPTDLFANIAAHFSKLLLPYYSKSASLAVHAIHIKSTCLNLFVSLLYQPN